MNFILGFIVGGATGLIIGYLVRPKSTTPPAIYRNDHLSESEKEKEENLARLREFISSTDKKITNDLIQTELGISDATATRYLDELK